jgi:hypothetical protein
MFPGAVVHIAVHLVCEAVVDEAAHEFDDLGDRLCHPRVDRGRFDVQRPHILEVRIDVCLTDVEGADAFFAGPVDDLVVDVGKVLNEADAVPPVFQVFPERVEHDERARVADMDVVVHRRPAHVDAIFVGIEWNKFFFLAS